MNRSQQDQLLSKVLTGDGVECFRQQSLENSLLWLDRHRCRKRAIWIGASVVAAALLLTVGVAGIRRSAFQAPQSKTVSRAVAAIDLPRREVEVKVITDQELFALFPGRPLALIGKPGQQRLVFLDQ